MYTKNRLQSMDLQRSMLQRSYSSFLHGFCCAGGSHVQTEVKQPQLPVECPLCKFEEIPDQESESSCLPHADSVSLQFSSVSDYYDHIIWCHLSLLGIPRVCKSCTVSQRQQSSHGETFCGWQCAQIEKHVPRRGSEREKNATVEPLRPGECYRKPEVGRCLGAHLAIR